jgi:hypothetical protein
MAVFSRTRCEHEGADGEESLDCRVEVVMDLDSKLPGTLMQRFRSQKEKEKVECLFHLIFLRLTQGQTPHRIFARSPKMPASACLFFLTFIIFIILL